MPGGPLRPSQLCGSACQSDTLLPKDRSPANCLSCAHRATLLYTHSKPLMKNMGFPLLITTQGFTCRLCQAQVYPGGACHAQTTSLKGVDFKHPAQAEIISMPSVCFAEQSSLPHSPQHTKSLIEYSPHRTALSGCLRKFQCNLPSGLGCPESPPCPHFLPPRRTLCSLCPE